MANGTLTATTVETALEKIKAEFLDEEGFIVQAKFKNRDGGDSLNRLGHLYSLLYLLDYEHDLQGRYLQDGFRTQLGKLTVAPGLYRRHWDKSKWYFNENTTSRDQYTPIVIAAGLLGETHILNDIIEYLKRNGLRYPNTISNDDPSLKPKHPDILLPGSVAELLRGGGNISGLQPFDEYSLSDLDCAQVYMSRFRKMQQVGDGADGGSDDLNLTLTLLYGLTKGATPSLHAAAYEYFNASQKPIDRLRYYFRPSSGAPPLDEVYEAGINVVLQEHPPNSIGEPGECKIKISRMMQTVADRAWKNLRICEGLRKTFGPITVGIDKPADQNVTGLEFEFSHDYARLALGVEVTCKTSEYAAIKTEIKAHGKAIIVVNPSTCEVQEAKLVLDGELCDLISISDIELDLKEVVQKELSGVCSKD